MPGCIASCDSVFISLGGLPFSEGKERSSESGERGDWGCGDCGKDGVYEKKKKMLGSKVMNRQ